MQPSITTVTPFEESIPLRPVEKKQLSTRNGWNQFLASSPLPALWITAHVNLSISSNGYAALDQLRMELMLSRSTESLASAYRVFLQKFIIQINRRILKSTNSTTVFRFRGTLERNYIPSNGTALHYHFFLWGPDNLFVKSPHAIDKTAAALTSLWHRKVNDRESDRCKPIHIEVIHHRSDAETISSYMNKGISDTNSYELIDDWTTSRRSSLGSVTDFNRPTRRSADVRYPSAK